MSSTYRVLCLSHDPAIEASGEDFRSPGEAVDASLSGPIRESHPQCDLVVGRFSYPLISVLGLDSMKNEWVRSEFLRLALRAKADDPDVKRLDALGAMAQIRRLAGYLEG